MQLTSIYGYPRERFGMVSHCTGASWFIISRLMGATLRRHVVLNADPPTAMSDMGGALLGYGGCGDADDRALTPCMAA
ncbi:MAG: hypothetical protein IPJ76_19055 [Flavobacteriales bacterium]|nr:MAG: hypothetical protein IPJ76_19055 [Flavobacteriales bacterium]